MPTLESIQAADNIRRSPNHGDSNYHGEIYSEFLRKTQANLSTLSTAADGLVTAVNIATTGGTIGNSGVTMLTTVPSDYTLTAPTVGVRKVITAVLASTAARTINSGSGVTYTTTQNLLTSTGIQTIELVGLTTARWGMISNYSPTTAGMALTTA